MITFLLQHEIILTETKNELIQLDLFNKVRKSNRKAHCIKKYMLNIILHRSIFNVIKEKFKKVRGKGNLKYRVYWIEVQLYLKNVKSHMFIL